MPIVLGGQSKTRQNETLTSYVIVSRELYAFQNQTWRTNTMLSRAVGNTGYEY